MSSAVEQLNKFLPIADTAPNVIGDTVSRLFGLQQIRNGTIITTCLHMWVCYITQGSRVTYAVLRGTLIACY